MKYEGSLQHNDLDIYFEFAMDGSCEGLVLTLWDAYSAQTLEQVHIPCRVEADYIERLIEEHLAEIWDREGCNYIQDYKEYLGDKMHDYYQDR